MARPVRLFGPLWFDNHFKRELRRLPRPEQESRLQEIADLTHELASCRHPTLDPRLARWRPSAYRVPKIPSEKRLCEYRCSFPMRVIARWIEPSTEDPEGAVLLVAVTLSHDHERLKEIITKSRSEL
jgi:hypothetical protein